MGPGTGLRPSNRLLITEDSDLAAPSSRAARSRTGGRSRRSACPETGPGWRRSRGWCRASNPVSAWAGFRSPQWRKSFAPGRDKAGVAAPERLRCRRACRLARTSQPALADCPAWRVPAIRSLALRPWPTDRRRFPPPTSCRRDRPGPGRVFARRRPTTASGSRGSVSGWRRAGSVAGFSVPETSVPAAGPLRRAGQHFLTVQITLPTMWASSARQV